MAWSRYVPEGALHACAMLRESGFEAYIVGGAMRDVLMERIPSDWDIATSARPDTVIRLFPKVVPTGIQHGTVTVVLPDGSYEVTTFRGEGAYSDGRRPDSVFFLDRVEDDLARRDFTINAIAGDPLSGDLVDPFDGQGDIRRRLIRAVGNPDARFDEDGLRTLRAARFAAMLEFDVDLETEAAIPRHLATFGKVAVERKFDEIIKMLIRSPLPSRGFVIMLKTGLLEAVLPELAVTAGMEQNKYHEFDVFTHTMYAVDATPPRLTLKLAALLHDIGKPKARVWAEHRGEWAFYGHEEISAKLADAWLKKMKTSTELREEVVALVLFHHVKYKPDWTDVAVRRWIRKVGPCRVHDLLEFRRADIAGHGDTPYAPEHMRLVDALQEHVTVVMSAQPALDVCNLAVTGDDIMRVLDVKPGRIIGQVKQALLELVLERPELNTQETLEALIPKVAGKVGKT